MTDTPLKHFLLASDFDQTLSFHDSGIILSEILGITDFEQKIRGLSDIHLVQQGGELAYLVLHAGCRFRLGIRENKRAHDFGGNYPNSPSYQLLRIYDTSIAIWND